MKMIIEQVKQVLDAANVSYAETTYSDKLALDIEMGNDIEINSKKWEVIAKELEGLPIVYEGYLQPLASGKNISKFLILEKTL